MIHYEIAGNGPPMILLHGIGSNSKSWRRQLAVFSKHLKVIAWDAPGFGKSNAPPADSASGYAEQLDHLLNELNIQSAIILGHSFGGIVAQEFYRQHSHRVKALILSATTQGGGDPTNRLRMIRTLTPLELASERAPKLLSKHAPQELIDEAVAIMSEVRREGYESAAIAISKADTRGVLDDISIPLLMIWGTDDEITPPWQVWPAKAHVEMIPNAGHLCYAERPESFNRIVSEFLAGNALAPGT